MADDEVPDEKDETEVVTFTASRECKHFRAEVILQMAESDDPTHELRVITNLMNGLKGASGFVPNPDLHVHEFSQVLEAPTPESIDAAVENFRVELQKHLQEHRHEESDERPATDE